MKKTLISYVSIPILAFLSALNYCIFIFPNRFAPAGIDGIFTMIQDVSGISMGYMSFLANLPLLLVSLFCLKRDYTCKTALYVLCFSASVVLLKQADLSGFSYHTDSGTSIVLAPIAAGAIRGLLYVATLKTGASSGGMDILAALVQKRRPHLNLMNIIFVFNILVAISSYFVYGFKPEPVICSIIYAFLTSSVTNRIDSLQNQTVKFEIITQDADALCVDIINKLHLSATVLDAHGAYSKRPTEVVLCIVKKEDAPALETVLRTYENITVFKSTVSSKQ